MSLKEFQGAFVEGLMLNSLGRIHFGCQEDPFSVSQECCSFHSLSLLSEPMRSTLCFPSSSRWNDQHP